MKKIMLFAAACVALAACNKGIDTTTPEIGDVVSFEKGQQVSLTANAPAATKVTGSLNATTDAVDFKWETGDKIKVTVGTESAEFTLSSGAGTASATFTGTMPAGGNSFNVQYPVTDPDLSTQTYVENGLPKDKMKMTATGCTIKDGFTLTPQYAALRLNLYGGAREVSQIVVTGSSSATYTLSLSSAVMVGKDKDNATPFLIVLPATESFVSAAVTANAITATTDNTKSYESYGIGFPISASTTFAPTAAKSLTAGSILNMPAVSLTTVWAPVNCGYDATDYPYGLLFQWGRKYGQGYHDFDFEDADYPGKAGGHQFLVDSSSPLTSHPDGAEYNGNFYHDSSYTIEKWYGGSDPDNLWNSNEGTSNPVSKSEFDPCPEGWRVPTMSELDKLAGGDGSRTANLGGSGWDSKNKGYWFNGTESPEVGAGLFLPVAGYRDYASGSAFSHDYGGFYWSSSVNDSNAWSLAFGGSSAGVSGDYRAYGFSVRCVQE